MTRAEFSQYCSWACSQLPNLRFGHTVDAISCDEASFVVHVGHECLRARNIIVGTGLSPAIPACARPHLGDTVFHASQFLLRDFQPAGRRIAVIGGGQTAAEVILWILSNRGALPSQLLWISRRPNFQPMDDSPFSSSPFNPEYVTYFQRLASEQRARLLDAQKLASDGISTALLETIYEHLYRLVFVEERRQLCRLLPDRELTGMRADGCGWVLQVQEWLTTQTQELAADAVVLCTGYAPQFPSYLQPLAERIPWVQNAFHVQPDYSIAWDGPETLKLFVQNGARHTHGINDPNLSLMAWRSATIVNSIANKPIYRLPDYESLISWPGL